MSGIVLAAAGSRANVTRTILSCAGIMIGVGALILIVTGGDVGERFAESYAESNAGVATTLDVSIYDPSVRIEDLGPFEDDLRRAGAQSVSMVAMANTEIRIGAKPVPDVWTEVVDAELGDIRRITMASGRWFDDADRASLAPALVVNEGLAERFPRDGGRLQIAVDGQWRTARVVGVIEDTAMDRGQYTAYVLRGAASASLVYPDGGLPENGITYKVRLPPEVTEAAPYVERLKTAGWRWRSIGENEMDAYRSDFGDQIQTVLTYLSLGLGGIALITMATGMLGVLNVGLVTVRERRRELATYRALGASSFALFIIVVTEAVVVSLVAGVIALLLCYAIVGVGGVLLADYLPADVAVYVPVEALLIGLGSAAVAGLLAGVIPAWRALRTSVVSGLRE